MPVIMSFDDMLNGFSNLIYNGCFPSRVHDQLAGELIKARLMKASNRFDEALAVVNDTLRKIPNYPEALFLKAQILYEGFSDDDAAAACLKKIVLMKSMKDETLRRWSQNLLKEIAEQRRVRSSISG
jgi:uncharacterized protein HemY